MKNRGLDGQPHIRAFCYFCILMLTKRHCILSLFLLLTASAIGQSLLNDPVVPDSLLQDRKTAYHYYKAHYWDECHLNDSSLVKIPAFKQRLLAFFEQVVPPLPDSINMEIDKLVASIDNKAVRDEVLWTLLEKYLHPEYMTHDQVFIHLSDRYFSQLPISGLTEDNRRLIMAKADQWRRLILFSTAPNLQLFDKKGRTINMQDIESEYLVLFFYDHDCDICKEESHDLEALCQVHPEVKVLAIDTNYPFKPYKNGFIHVSIIGPGDDPMETYDVETTPLLYILDRNKRIIAKKLMASQIEQLLFP